MKIILLFFFSTLCFAQINILQDSPQLDWRKIENSDFKVVFPDHVEAEAKFVFELLNYYKDIASKTYDISPKKLTVVLRSQSAEPNGFVTVAPRRSELFMSANFSPFVGSLDWYQSLAVHEYRHVVQFDYLNRSNIKTGYYFFGEFIQGALLNLILPGWYFEGDAVWIETVASNGGRGRSPRFSARLKAILSSGEFPSYDELITGNFNDVYPNHYVYGYFLITRGIIEYGPKFWKEVVARASDDALNPYALYGAFYELTGLSFEQFYNETFEELKRKWGQQKQDKIKYQAFARPIKDQGKLYHLKRTLDHRWQLKEGTKVLSELNIVPSMSKSDLKNEKFVYIQSRPSPRFFFKNFSDLFLYDLKENKHIRLSYDQRYYHPVFNSQGSQIAIINFDQNNNWGVNILDLNGEIQKSLKGNSDFRIMEVSWKSDNELYAIVINFRGEKSIAIIDLENQSIVPITPFTRNNLYNLNYQQTLVFEADDKGVVNIFSYDEKSNEFARCTQEFIRAKDPYSINNTLFYSATVNNGEQLIEKPLNCKKINKEEIFTNYLGKSPSDFYHQSPPKKIDSFEQIKVSKVKSESFGEHSEGVTPHSWSFIGARGYQLQINTNNYLNTLGLNVAVGNNAEEGTPFGSIALQYSKYYPIFSLYFDHSKRNVQLTEGEDRTEWEEQTIGLNTTLPYVFIDHLYSGAHLLNFNYNHINVSKINGNLAEYELSDDTLINQGVSLSTSYIKTPIAKEVSPQGGFDLTVAYDDFKLNSNQDQVSFLGSYNLNFYHPSLWDHHGFKWNISGEYRPENKSLWQQQTAYVPIIGYTYSRGYTYEFTPRFNKYTLEYKLPLFYPSWGYKGWISFNRVQATLFFDHTLSEFNRGDRTLNSKGVELLFESLTFRKFPFKYGLRIFNRELDDSNHAEIYLSLL